jgi:hypothetical protein
MSKAVRIRDHLHAELERLAKEEKRSLTNMVEVLLEQALRLPDKYVPPVVTVTKEQMEQIEAGDVHFKPDFGKKL